MMPSVTFLFAIYYIPIKTIVSEYDIKSDIKMSNDKLSKLLLYTAIKETIIYHSGKYMIKWVYSN